jgi:hypothetical protein
MAPGINVAKDRYYYPSAEAEFNLYNFQAQQQVDVLADLLVSTNKDVPLVIQLLGEPGSGRALSAACRRIHCWATRYLC